MPIFNDDDAKSATSFKSGSGFHFSGTNINNLGASEYTLVGIAADVSSSVSGFAKEIEGCLVSSIEGCQKSPRADTLLARFTTFCARITEEHGFRPLADCHLANYAGSIRPGGTTALYDASVDIVDSLATYGKDLTARDYTANGIVVVMTDGMDVGSTLTAKAVAEAARAGQRVAGVAGDDPGRDQRHRPGGEQVPEAVQGRRWIRPVRRGEGRDAQDVLQDRRVHLEVGVEPVAEPGDRVGQPADHVLTREGAREDDDGI